MKKFNFLHSRTADDPTLIIKEDAPIVRTRATTRDQFAGLRGRDYIAARNLGAPVKRLTKKTTD
jgi:hypothetical protein